MAPGTGPAGPKEGASPVKKVMVSQLVETWDSPGARECAPNQAGMQITLAEEQTNLHPACTAVDSSS